MEAPRVEHSPDDGDDLAGLRRAAGGDARAFHELVDRHGPRLYRLAVSLVGMADAEDVVQETFVGMYGGLRKFQGRSSVRTWMTRILFLQAAKWRRQRKNRRAEPMPEGREPAAAGSGQAADARMDLRTALLQMSVEHREVLVLRELEQMSYEEIAAVLDVPRGTVESRLHRARQHLREKLTGYALNG